MLLNKGQNTIWHFTHSWSALKMSVKGLKFFINSVFTVSIQFNKTILAIIWFDPLKLHCSDFIWETNFQNDSSVTVTKLSFDFVQNLRKKELTFTILQKYFVLCHFFITMMENLVALFYVKKPILTAYMPF